MKETLARIMEIGNLIDNIDLYLKFKVLSDEYYIILDLSVQNQFYKGSGYIRGKKLLQESSQSIIIKKTLI